MTTRDWTGEVEQITAHGASVTLHKELWQTTGDPSLGLVRKHLPGGPTRPPVMLVHGFAQNRYSWHNSTRSMSAWLAAQGWDVWNLEMRGHGRSRSSGRGAEAFQDYVDDVLTGAAALPGPAFWVGHSLGGAASYGAATLSARAESASPLGVVGIGAIYNFAQANPLLEALSRLTYVFENNPLVLSNVQIRTRLLGQVLGRLYALSDPLGYAFPLSGWWPGSIEQGILEERLTHGFDWTSIKIWQEMSRWGATRAFEYDEGWSQTDLPVMVVAGDCDRLVPPGDARPAFDRSGSSDKTWVLLDDYEHQTHWGHLDLIFGKHAPDVVWPLVHEWMAERS